VTSAGLHHIGRFQDPMTGTVTLRNTFRWAAADRPRMSNS